LENFFNTGKRAGIVPAHSSKLARQLAALSNSKKPEHMNFPGWRLHPLHGDLENYWSVTVSGNWRLVFTFVDGEAVQVDYLDYQ